MNKEDYTKEMRNNIRDVRARLDEMITNIDKEKDETKYELRKNFHKVKDKVNEIDKMLDKVGDVTEETWAGIKTDINEMWAETQNILSNKEI